MPLDKLIFVVAIRRSDFSRQGREEPKIFNRRWTHFDFSHLSPFSPIFLRDQILHWLLAESLKNMSVALLRVKVIG